jgi:hypothetical protein
LHNKSVAAKSHYAFKSNFLGSPQFANALKGTVLLIEN